MFWKVLFFMIFCAVASANGGKQSLSEDGKAKGTSIYELIILTLVWIAVLILVLSIIAICIRACRRLKNKRRSKDVDVELKGNLIDCNKLGEINEPTDSFDDLNENPKLVDIGIQANENPNQNHENEISERSESAMSPSIGWKFPGEKVYSIETVDQTALCKVDETSVPVDDNINVKSLVAKLKMMKLTSDQEKVVDLLGCSNQTEDMPKVELTVEEVKVNNALMITELTQALYNDFQNSIKPVEPADLVESTSLVTSSTKNRFQENDETEVSKAEPELEMEIPQISESSSSDINTIDHFETDENSLDDKISMETQPHSTPDSQVSREESHSIVIKNPPTSCEEDIRAELTKLGIPHTEFMRFYDLNKVPISVCAVGSGDNMNPFIGI